MVHIARGALDRAESVLREGTIVQDRQADLQQRYPAKGLHWLLGLVRLARGDAAEARVEFEREIAIGPSQLYAAEFAMNAHDGAGFAALRHGTRGRGGAHVPAARSSSFPEHARSLVGLGAALAAGGDRARPPTRSPARRRRSTRCAAAAARARRRSPRRSCTRARPRRSRPCRALHALLEPAGLPFTGWTIPIEPLFEPLRAHA